MLRVGFCLRMTNRALEDRVVRRIRVARRAYASRVAVVRRKPRVIERGARPRCSRVARLAGGRKTRRHVVRIRRRQIVRLVAGIAIRRRARIDPADVARTA